MENRRYKNHIEYTVFVKYLSCNYLCRSDNTTEATLAFGVQIFRIARRSDISALQRSCGGAANTRREARESGIETQVAGLTAAFLCAHLQILAIAV
jgi:hypothetical protein